MLWILSACDLYLNSNWLQPKQYASLAPLGLFQPAIVFLYILRRKSLSMVHFYVYASLKWKQMFSKLNLYVGL